MDRRQVLGALGAGLSGLSGRLAGAQGSPPELDETLRRFLAVDWQRHAVMTKAAGQEPPWHLRMEAEFQAARAGEAALDGLLRLTPHESPHARGFAAQMLGVIGAPRVGETLRSLLADDASAQVRGYAVEALSRLRETDEAAAAAIGAARRDRSGFVRFSAQQAELRLRQKLPAGAVLREEWTAGYDARRLGTARPGEPAPEFSLAADDGRRFRLADLRGKESVVLLFQLADW